MSSMRNAVQRRNHRERAQPHAREKIGILEKHKDYALRAEDFKTKKRHLRNLRQKAAERNPDEFHFGMLSSRTDNTGRKTSSRGNAVLSNQAALSLKSQDSSYLRTLNSKTKRDLQALEQASQVHYALDPQKKSAAGVLPETERPAHRTLFADATQEDVAKHSDDLDLDSQFRAGAESLPLRSEEARSRKSESTRTAWRLRNLRVLRQREEQLTSTIKSVDDEQARMKNTTSGKANQGRSFKVKARKR